MTGRDWDDIAAGALDAVAAANRLRQPRDLDGGGIQTAQSATGQPVVSFASNDYLGLSQHSAVRAAARAAIDCYGAGAGSARLIVGSRPVHSRLEERIAAWRGAEAAVLFTTGYAANLGVISTMGRWASVICSDELNHASIIDGCRLARAPTRVYPHCDPAAADDLLSRADGPGMVVSDSVFSMDGDLAPITELSAVCAARGALLVVDDAHSVLGHPETLHPDCRVLRVGTLSKAVGALGGYAAGPRPFIDLLVNAARSYIFTTASTPAAAAAAAAAIDIIDSAEGDDLRMRLRANIDRVRPGHPSGIIPFVVGDEDRALAASAALLEVGILVPAIRPPTVPAGTSRLRVTVSAAHTDDDLDRLIEALSHAGIHVGDTKAPRAREASEPERPASTANKSGGQTRAAREHSEQKRAGQPEPAAGSSITVFVTATGTEAGKTWASAGLARLLRDRGRAVAACKPVQSFDPDDPAPTDAAVLAAATGQHPDEVCGPERSYRLPVAPPMAARRLGRSCPTIDELAESCRFAAPVDVGIVEGVGGLYSPLAADGYNLDLIDRIRPDLVVVVASADLGGIHDTLACTLPLGDRRLAVFCNRFDPHTEVHALNAQWLRATGLEVTTTVSEMADTVLALFR